MSLTGVKMTEEVWLTCLTHALSTETEEIMGLLLGDIEVKDGGMTALIWGALPQPRSDRKKDRVETTPEELSAATAHADRMTLSTGIVTRVIGWYHSHPHITVLPSHVDVRTQALYQILDKGFIGLIFSCFSEDAEKVGRIQIIAFQSSDGEQNHILTPVTLPPPETSSVIDLESSTSSSNRTGSRSGFTRADLKEDTADSRINFPSHRVAGTSSDLGGFFDIADARTGESYPIDQDIDPMDLSDHGMQEAMHLSSLEMSGAEYVRKEVRLDVVPSQHLLNLSSPLASFVGLQRVLYEEERTAYTQALEQNTRNGKMHPLTFIHHTSTYQASMCKLIEYCLSPAINALQVQLKENEMRLKLLSEESQTLESEVSRMNEQNSSSPRNQFSHVIRNSSGSVVPRDLHRSSDSSNSRNRRKGN